MRVPKICIILLAAKLSLVFFAMGLLFVNRDTQIGYQMKVVENMVLYLLIGRAFQYLPDLSGNLSNIEGFLYKTMASFSKDLLCLTI